MEEEEKAIDYSKCNDCPKQTTVGKHFGMQRATIGFTAEIYYQPCCGVNGKPLYPTKANFNPQTDCPKEQ